MEITSDHTKATADMKGIRIDDGTSAKLNHCAGPHNAMPEMDEPFHSRLSVRAALTEERAARRGAADARTATVGMAKVCSFRWRRRGSREGEPS